MSENNAEGTYTSKPEETKSEAPTSLVEALRQQNTNGASIQKEVGESIAFPKGRDYEVVQCRVIDSTYKSAVDDERAIYIRQGKNLGISISLPTLEAIVNWAKNNT